MISVLSSSNAGDEVLVADLTVLVNRAYELADEGLWLSGVARTTEAETAEAIADGQVAVAREDGRLLGSVRFLKRDETMAWFGVLAVDGAHGGQGVGAELVKFVESAVAASGARVMELELLVPTAAHPHTARLAAWYRRLGYVEAERRDLAVVEPTAVPFLAVACEVSLMRKALCDPVQK
jgi:GNAT superfamily N-acetyltransferase